jgi:sulfoxide reductase heme-binding subunit YedZ
LTEAQLIRRILKPVLWVAGLSPLAWQVWAFFTGHLEAEPVKGMEHFTGKTAIIILLITLAVTPIRRITRWNGIIKVRRLIGLFAFFYALVHFLIFLTFDLEWNFGQLAREVVERPWITVGFTALVLLAILAITSPQVMVRKLGKKWTTLHRLIYFAAGLAVLHFIWSQKKDIRTPLLYLGVLAVLLLARLVLRPRAGRSKPRVIESRA